MRFGWTLAVMLGLSMGCAVPTEDGSVAEHSDGVKGADLPDYGFTSLSFQADDVLVARLVDVRWVPDTFTLAGTTTKGVSVTTSVKVVGVDPLKGIARYMATAGAPLHNYNDVAAESASPNVAPKFVSTTVVRPINLDDILGCYGRKPPTPPNCDPGKVCVMPIFIGCNWY